MDTLALLCNLHADGPATLRELQRIGCRSAQELVTIDAPALARALDSDEDYARWFREEADRLADRFGQPIADKSPSDRSAVSRDGRRADRALSPVRPSLAHPPLPALVEAPPVPAEPARSEPAPAADRPQADAGSESASVTGDTVLRPGLLEGLDEAWCSALVHQGIRTIGGLVEDGSMALARRLGRPYTRLVDLQSLAAMLLRRSTIDEPARAGTEARADARTDARTDAGLEPGATKVSDESDDGDEPPADDGAREFTLFPRAQPRRPADDTLTHDPFSGGGWGAHHDPGTAGPFS